MTSNTQLLAFFQSIGPMELILIGGIALLLFGGRVPDVARSLGKGIVEFKKGLREVQDEVESAGREQPKLPPKPDSDHTSNPPPSVGG